MGMKMEIESITTQCGKVTGQSVKQTRERCGNIMEYIILYMDEYQRRNLKEQMIYLFVPKHTYTDLGGQYIAYILWILYINADLHNTDNISQRRKATYLYSI